MPEDIKPIKLFKPFFPVKEMENTGKQTNGRAASIGYIRRPLAIQEGYRYLGSPTYMGIQSLHGLTDYWI